METEVLKEQHYVEELVEIIRSGLPKEELIDRLSDYHDNDIADALTKLTPDERRELYPLIGVERVAEIFAYLDDAEPYLKELPIESAAKIVSEMDSDDAVDVLEEMDATTKHKIVGMLDKEASEDVRLLFSYDEDEIGSRMTTNFIMIHNNLTIRQAMREEIPGTTKFIIAQRISSVQDADLVVVMENGKIDVCIIKDMTRWGRDYLQTGNTMKIFRRNNVRFITA